MSQLTDQQVQEWLEAQRQGQSKSMSISSDAPNFQMYKRLFDELANEPPNTALPYLFATHVTQMIQQQAISRNERRSFILYGLSVFAMLLAALVALFMNNQEGFLALTYDFTRLGIPLGATLAGLALIQWADYRFVRRSMK